MPVYQLIADPLFPPVELAEDGGLLAVGGDLSPRRLLLAYSMGIFPWFNAEDPILWWSPDPRFILELDDLHVSRSLAKVLRRGLFSVTFDQAFGQVIRACAQVRAATEGTWITPAMLASYERLHEMGYAHSVEVWRDGELVGGLYGVCLGRCFFGESMFHRAADASKVALVALVERLKARDFELLDCQMPSDHLTSLGARSIPRAEFLKRLRRGGVMPSVQPQAGDFP
ncbi:leucyl/phenylalanyl-tRNA--protein transferase [Geoalkalibacter halelectricus]|uniref:Leucyl/phenylalanyl-tRNA--protein transferase n=1 Tax=Geoalkalibacter halelectricus TaxID=2847045 RepID=A0ABY5ZLX5_9BACT|nr:leucyl/phenylalanyl-tRNA--protein transferase [Geoalkalibacter halelectricus]MDO3379006.1 leucyl/phenylalanyl-tRNA--protein transferase [Geoalkalibacter halelectricus]UWZ78820.1 leucyl/phenylalanyl-tRNA--protein transferase [Geoalkalibacter halelectricus]